MLLLRRLTIVVMATALSVSTSAAYGAVDQEGKQTSITSVDGTTGDITPNSFNPASSQCDLYSILIFDATTSRQVETGLARCSGATIDGTCTDGHAFSERYDGTGYYCSIGSSFPTGSATNALLERTSGTTAIWGSIAGAYNSQTGFGASDSIRAYAWAEATGPTSSCPSMPHSASFANWKKFSNSNGWSYVSVDVPYSVYGGISGAPCWTVGSLGGNGGFSVS